MRGCAAAAAGLKMPCLLRRMSIRAALRRGAAPTSIQDG